VCFHDMSGICSLYIREQLIASSAVVVAKYCDEYVCLWLCLSVCPQGYLPEPHARFTKFLCMLSMSVARSSFGKFAIGRIAYSQEGFFFPTENELSAGKGDRSAQRGRGMLSTIALLNSRIDSNILDILLHVYMVV